MGFEMNLRNVSITGVVIWMCCLALPARADADVSVSSFVEAKTIFQTNTGYDPRLGIAVDAVVVHRHGAEFRAALDSWRKNGFSVGRMFFADSDASNAYWTGKWDGTPHGDDVERNEAGEVVKCAGVRPYMLPTEGWIRYLEEMTSDSLAAGACAILPEEPLAHVFTGYEGGFKKLWTERYKTPWQGQHSSAEARFLTAQLKNELYIKLEKRLLDRTRRSAAANQKDTGFVLPIHSIYSNIAAQLVAPLGTSTDIAGVDGYIGQIWTGPVNWALGCYDSPSKSFFASAYVLYDYFAQLTVESDRKLWLLVDPVEDNPNHEWSEFADWYKHCVVAMLLIDEVDSYEIMPWPDRIFLPGYGTGGGTPAPEDYRITILAVTQVLQEIPAGGQWQGQSAGAGRAGGAEGIGVAIADTLMWQRHDHPMLQGVYSLLLPLVERGIPVSSFILERLGDPGYMSRFKTIVLSYEDFKPVAPSMNIALADWVKKGGSLVVLGLAGDELDKCRGFWWHKLGFASPLDHLLAGLDAPSEDSSEWKFGAGRVLRNPVSPKRFAAAASAERIYLPLVGRAFDGAGDESLVKPGSFYMKRGPFVIAHAETSPLKLDGRLVDIFDPKLAVHDSVELSVGQSGLYRDVADVLAGDVPAVLHTTHRLMSQQNGTGSLSFTLRGPGGTPAVARIYLPQGRAGEIAAVDSQGKDTKVEVSGAGDTRVLKFANDPKGVTVTVK